MDASDKYESAGEAAQLARQVIFDWHSHLVNIPIEFVFVKDEIKEKGKLVLGRARKKTGLDAWLAHGGEDFFVIEICKPIWDEMQTKDRVALLDHELSHCKVDENDDGIKLSIVSHDVEEFQSVIERHGLWKPDLRAFGKACKEQLDLFEERDWRKGIDSVTLIIPEKETADTLA